jgi:hypothetical protein
MRIARFLLPAAAAAAALLPAAAATAFIAPVSAPHAVALAPTGSPTVSPVYVPGPPNLTLIPGTIFLGETVLLIGNNFGSNDTIIINIIFSPVAAGQRATRIAPVAFDLPMQPPSQILKADASGNFTTTITFNEVGTFLVVATGAPSTRSASAVESVVVSHSPSPSASETSPGVGVSSSSTTGVGLPVTGPSTNYVHVGLIGSAIAATGVVLVVMARSRRRRSDN